MLDVEGLSLSPADRALLSEPAVGGVILFTRNYASPAQVADLAAEIREVKVPPLLIAVDYEGGRVQRFRDGFTSIPPMRLLGVEYDVDPANALELAKTAGWIVGAELGAVGIDLSFSPCVDLDWGVSTVIGDRSFHKKPDVVAALAGAVSQGLREAGMSAVAKHFPGHGAVVADSHKHLPIDRREFGDVLDDMQPYDVLVRNRAIGAVMMAHVVFSETDPLPAGFSSYWIENQLRGQLRFDGAVFCDDLSMEAAAAFGSVPERAALALAAGCDMVLICNDRRSAIASVASLEDYSRPTSLVRLARLHGGACDSRDALLSSDTWRQAVEQLGRWADRPALRLGA